MPGSIKKLNTKNITKIRSNLDIINFNNTKYADFVNRKKEIAIYENLPSGGANTLLRSNRRYLKKKYTIKNINDKKYTTKLNGLLEYLYYIYVKQYFIQNSLKIQLSGAQILISYHTWVSKSPLILRQRKIPEIYICHEPPREYYDKQVILVSSIKDKIINFLRSGIKIIDRKNIKYNKNLFVIVNSLKSRKNINRIYGINSTVVYPGIDIHKFGNYSSITNRENIILCVGSINKLKNQLGVLKHISYTVIFAGNGGDSKYIQELHKYAINTGIKISVYLNLNEITLISLYKKSKIFIYDPVNEPFGIVILEALRVGIPLLVSSEGGGYAERLNANTGYILSKHDKNGWGNAINELLSNNAKWTSISEYNYIYAEQYSEDKMNNTLGDIIDKLIT